MARSAATRTVISSARGVITSGSRTVGTPKGLLLSITEEITVVTAGRDEAENRVLI